MRRPYRRSELSRRDLQVIELERRWGQSREAVDGKLAEASERLGLDERAYALIVASLVDDPRAHQVDPETLARLSGMRHRARDAGRA